MGMKWWSSYNKIYITIDEKYIIMKFKGNNWLKRAYDTQFPIDLIVIKSQPIGEVVCAVIRGGPKRHPQSLHDVVFGLGILHTFMAM